MPVAGAAVIVALDVSGSMCATDVDPNRLTAAQAAVREFVQAQDGSTRIGLVVFSGFAQVAVPPTTERQDLLTAIDSLTTGRGTTIGAAILKSIDAIAQINPDVAPADSPSASESPDGQAPGPGPGAAGFAPEIVVLLTDEANTREVTPAEAAEVAAARGVRVCPIEFGTTNPTTMVCTAEQLGGTGFGQLGPGVGGGQGKRNFLVADEAALQQVATTTGGTYFSASDADQPQAVLADLPRRQVVEAQQRDVELSAAPGRPGRPLPILLGRPPPSAGPPSPPSEQVGSGRFARCSTTPTSGSGTAGSRTTATSTTSSTCRPRVHWSTRGRGTPPR